MTRGTGAKSENVLKNSPRKPVNKIVSVYNEEDNTKHMRPITLKRDHNNNKMERLNGKTPAEACGIKVEGNNKWLTLIQNASKGSN